MSRENKQAGTGKYSLLVVVKGEHKYLIKYDPNRKRELLDLLVFYGMDDNYNLTTADTLALLERLEGSNGGASMISLNREKPSIERDLSIEEPADGGPETSLGL